MFGGRVVILRSDHDVSLGAHSFQQWILWKSGYREQGLVLQKPTSQTFRGRPHSPARSEVEVFISPIN
jgi:hypothetical protein